MSLFPRRPVLVVLGLLLAGCAHLPPPGLRMRGVSFQYQTYKAPSGLQVVLQEDHSQPIVGVVALVGSGSAADPQGKEGLAHLVEHLSFRSRPDGKSQVSNLLEYAGVGESNARTGLDDTVFWEFGPTESLAGLIKTEGQRLAHPLVGLDADTFDVERNVVRNELQQNSESGYPEEIFGWIQQSVFASGHPYARPGGGTEASLAAASLADAQAFVDAHYRPSNVTMVIAGDVTPDQVEALLKTLPPELTSITTPRAAPAAPSAQVAEAPAHALEHHVSAGVQTPVLYLAWPLPRGFDENSAVEDFVLNSVSSVTVGAYFRDDDITGMSASLEPGEQASMLVIKVDLLHGEDPEKSAEHVLDQIFRLWEPRTDSLASPRGAEPSWEFGQRRMVVASGLASDSESLAHRAVLEAEATHFTGDPTTPARALQKLAQVTPAQLQTFAYRYLKRDQARAIFVAPAPGAIAAPASITFDKEASADAVKVVYPPEVIRAIAHAPGAKDFVSFQLPTGLQVVIARRPGWPQVQVSLAMRGGYLDGPRLGAGTLGNFAYVTNNFRGDLADYGAYSSSWQTEDTTWYTERGGAGNIANLLAILANRLKAVELPGYAAVEINRRLVPFYEALNQRPEVRATHEEERSLFGQGFYGQAVSAADLQGVTASEISEWIDRTYQPKNAVLAIVGDVDPAETSELVRDWMGGWKGSGDDAFGTPEISWARSGGPPHTETVVIDRPGAKQEDLELSCVAKIDGPRDELALEMISELLSRDLDLIARQTLGATYGFRATVVPRRGGAAVMWLSGDVEESHFAHVLALVHSRWSALGAHPFTDEELNRARWAIARRYDLSLLTSEDLAKALIETRLQDWPLATLDELPELLTQLTAEDVQRVAQRCRQDAVVSVIGNPTTAGSALGAVWQTP